MTDKFYFLKALELKYKSKVEEATTTLKLYLSNPQPVADHSLFMDELDTWLGVLVDSEEKLKALAVHFPKKSGPSSDYVVTYTEGIVDLDHED